MSPTAGTAMLGSQVGKYSPILKCYIACVKMFYRVIESKNKDYAVGDLVQGYFGWKTHSICNGSSEGHPLGLTKVDPTREISPSTSVGILGMPG